MRQIGVLEHESLATRFSTFLTAQKIDNSIDASFDPKEEKASYAIWVHDEDKLAPAAILFERFLAQPMAEEFNVPEAVEPAFTQVEEERAEPKKGTARLTLLWIFLCVMAYFFNTMQEVSMVRAGFSAQGFLLTPIRYKLLYDIPPALDAMESSVGKIVAESTQTGKKTIDQIPPEMLIVEGTPYWQGIYNWAVDKFLGGYDELQSWTLFYKIKQGQIWRLFTPSLLHGSLLHIAFNMLWLWALGKEIDPRIGWIRSLFLTLSIGVVSNTVQYLMSGPFFLGYSGIVTGLAGFIWSRQTIAPWEGYPIRKSMLVFLAVFVLGMVALQIGSVVFLLLTHKLILPNIANSAHVAGAIWGLMMGRLKFFEARGAK